MIRQQGTWGELAKGMYVKDANDMTWKVIATKPAPPSHYVKVQNVALQTKILKPRPAETVVTLMVPTTEEAVATLQKDLGAVPEAIQDNETGILRVRPFPSAKRTAINLDLARSHLFLLHGIYVGDVKGMKEMVEAHEYGHEDPEKGAYVAHEHES